MGEYKSRLFIDYREIVSYFNFVYIDRVEIQF